MPFPLPSDRTMSEMLYGAAKLFEMNVKENNSDPKVSAALRVNLGHLTSALVAIEHWKKLCQLMGRPPDDPSKWGIEVVGDKVTVKHSVRGEIVEFVELADVFPSPTLLAQLQLIT